MAADATIEALDTNAKRRYSPDGFIDLVPSGNYLLKNIKFKSAETGLGQEFDQPFIASDEQGFTYADADAGLFDLNEGVAMKMVPARLKGQQLAARCKISAKEAAIAIRGGDLAFENGIGIRLNSLNAQGGRRLEIAMLYGRSATGLGRSVTGTTGGTATQYQFTISDATWAPRIWAVSLNANLECFNDSGTQVGTESVQILRYNLDSKVVVVTGSTTQITAIGSAVSAGICLFYDSACGVEMHGLDSILTNTGTLFNIDAATVPLWKANVFSAGSAKLTMDKILRSLTNPLANGLEGDIKVLLSGKTFSSLNSDEAALRVYDSSYRAELAKRGNNRIEFYYQEGSLEIISHSMVKEGEAMIVPVDQCRRVGATDLTMYIPGQDMRMFQNLENQMGYQAKVYADQALFLRRPSWSVKITDIVNP